MAKFKGFISITPQCIEIQLMANENFGRDLQIRHLNILVNYIEVVSSLLRTKKVDSTFSSHVT